jgi:hypothetical protein
MIPDCYQKHFFTAPVPEYYPVFVIHGKRPIIAKAALQFMDAQPHVGRVVFENFQRDFRFVLQDIG